MKYALLVAIAALFAGPAMAHPTTCVPPGSMVLQTVDGSLVLVNKTTLAVQPFYPSPDPDCRQLTDRNGLPFGSTGVVQTNLDDGRVITEFQTVTVPDVSTTAGQHLLATPMVTTKDVPAVKSDTQTMEATASSNNCGTFINKGRDMTVICNRDQTGAGWWSGSSNDSYYTPPFTLADLQARCPSVDLVWADKALRYYGTDKYHSFFQHWRIDLN